MPSRWSTELRAILPFSVGSLATSSTSARSFSSSFSPNSSYPSSSVIHPHYLLQGYVSADWAVVKAIKDLIHSTEAPYCTPSGRPSPMVPRCGPSSTPKPRPPMSGCSRSTEVLLLCCPSHPFFLSPPPLLVLSGKTFGNLFKDYNNRTSTANKPMLITEFGVDSYIAGSLFFFLSLPISPSIT